MKRQTAGPPDLRTPNRSKSLKCGRSTSEPADLSRTRFSEADVLEARQALSVFVDNAAARVASEIGFGWVPDSRAPDRYADLRSAYRISELTGEGLPVSDLFCDSTIYTDPKTNMAFRFWHDVSHVRMVLSFELVDELELACWHLSELEAAGHAPGELVWQLLHADLVGQVYTMALARRFPLNQRAFVLDCVQRGFDRAVLAECRLPQLELADAGALP